LNHWITDVEAAMAIAWTHTIPHRKRRPGLLALLRTWYLRTRQRQALVELDEHLLRDCGLTREQARREADKPFWMA
jgi:uncharacterized protein YjiS (DUF1127 family)